MNSKSLKGKIILLLGAIVWGFAFVMQSKASNIIEPFTVNTLRCLVGAIVLLPLVIFFSKKNKRPILEKNIEDKKNLLIASTLAGIFICIGMNFQQFGIALYPDDAASSGRSGFITALYVVFVPIVSLFLKKKLKINATISVLLSAIGLYLLCFTKGINSIYLGDILVLCSALGYTFQIIVIDSFSNKVDGVKLSMFQFIICAILSAILMFVFEKPNINNIIDALLPILYLGVISTGCGYTLQIIGQQYSQNPTVDSIIMSLESVFAVLGGCLFLHEKLSIYEILGCCILFIAIIISQLPDINFKKITK